LPGCRLPSKLVGVLWLRVVIINDFSVARGGATTLVQLLARLLRDRGIPVTMLVGDDGKNAELESLDIEIVKLGRTRLLDRGAVSAAVEGIWNPSASSLVDRWIEANDTPQTVYHVHVFSQILSPSIFKVLRSVARRTVIHAHDFFHACPNGAFMDYKKNEMRPAIVSTEAMAGRASGCAELRHGFEGALGETGLVARENGPVLQSRRFRE
jgi:hypothetical protein